MRGETVSGHMVRFEAAEDPDTGNPAVLFREWIRDEYHEEIVLVCEDWTGVFLALDLTLKHETLPEILEAISQLAEVRP